MMETIDIRIDGRTASRIYGGEVLSEVTALLAAYPSVFLVYDWNIEPYALPLAQAIHAPAKAVEAREAGKTLDTVLTICDWLLESGADRQSLLLAVGGGITTDMAGFAACIYKRGIRFAFIPTTLLAQVDAAIGGKTGVNFEGYKNMLGVIRQPEFTYICPQVLESLPYPVFLSGAAELLKTFIIDNRSGGYAHAVDLLTELHARRSSQPLRPEDKPRLGALIHAAAAVKAGIVGRDPEERGERRKLNLGHTFAHAIEKLSGGAIAHGEAVAIGILLAARLAEALHIPEASGLAARLEADFRACGLPVDCPFPLGELEDAMAKDKKAEGGSIRFIVPEGIGSVREVLLTGSEAINRIRI